MLVYELLINISKLLSTVYITVINYFYIKERELLTILVS